MFKVTGWIFAESGKKCVPFSDTCEALGVLFTMCNSENPVCLISNTERRIAEICEELDRVLVEKKLSVNLAQRLRGRLQFAEAQIFGRCGKRCLAVLSAFASGRKRKLDDNDTFFLEAFKAMMKSGRPRLIKRANYSVAAIFIDVCYERESRDWICGLGGVLVLPHTTQRRFFSLELTDEQRKQLGELRKKQIIFEAETLSAILAAHFWLDACAECKCVLMVDNEGTKFSLIKGLSENPTVNIMCRQFAQLEVDKQVMMWISRVPSYSNIADAPSRGDRSALDLGHRIDCSVEAAKLLDVLMNSMLRGG